MKELVLNSISVIHYGELAQVFVSQGIAIAERETKQPLTRELLFYCSPEVYLSTYLDEPVKVKSPAALLNEWKNQIEEQMDYVLSNPETCFLVDFDYAVSHKDEFFHFLKESLDIEITDLHILMPDRALLAKNCLQLIDDDILQEAYEDIIAAADFFNKAECSTAPSRLRSIIVEMQRESEVLLSEKKTLTVEINQQQEENAKILEELATSVASKVELSRNIKTLQSENERIEAERDQQESDNYELQKELNKLKSDNELALLQVGQLQDELKSTVRSVLELNSSNEALSCESEQFKADCSQHHVDNTKLQEKLSRLESDNELGLLQAEQLQDELESTVRSVLELNSSNEALSRENEQFKAECSQHHVDNTKLQEELNRLESDNELGLLQVGQLQEELEFYFIKLQENRVSEFSNSIVNLRLSNINSSLQLANLMNTE